MAENSAAMLPYAHAIRQAYPISAPVVQQPKPSLWDSYRAVLAPAQPEPMGAVQSAVMGLRHNLESAAIGSLLGVIHGKLGTLDIAGKYPADGIMAAVLYLLSIKEAGKPDGFSADLRAMSQSCTSVAFFRKTSQWASAAGQAPGDVMSRHTGNSDPLVSAAKKYGL